MSRKKRVSLILWLIIILASGGLLILDFTGHRTVGDASWILYLHAIIVVMAVGAFVSTIRDKKES